jgi:hypothetical protein
MTTMIDPPSTAGSLAQAPDGPARPRRAPALGAARPGLLIKQLVLLIGAVYLGFVALTNAVDAVAAIGGYRWTFLNSGNVAYIASVTKVYGVPHWANILGVCVAAAAEGIGAALFARALATYRGAVGRAGGSTGVRAAWTALGWNIAIWLGFIAGTEFFLAYQAEGPFRGLLAIGLLMAIAFAAIPDDAGANG